MKKRKLFKAQKPIHRVCTKMENSPDAHRLLNACVLATWREPFPTDHLYWEDIDKVLEGDQT